MSQIAKYLIFFAIALLVFYFKNKRPRDRPQKQEGQTSSVQSVWLKMELDHDSGDLEGTVIKGQHKDCALSSLKKEELYDLYKELHEDAESVTLLETYLDRRFPTWREDAQSGTGSGHAHSFASGSMSKEEAYQVLGLADGASTTQIKSAHRRLLKAVHPDAGGTSDLAARVNKAKDVLLN